MIDSDILISEFRERQATKKAETTAKDYAFSISELADWLKNADTNRESKELWEATTADLRRHLRGLLDDYAGNTINNRHIAINVFYREIGRMAEEGYDIPETDNPAEDLDLSGWTQLNKGTLKEQKLKEPSSLTPEQVKTLTENVDSPTLRNELIVRILYQTGMRRGELAETRIKDIDRDDRVINIRATKTHLNRKVAYPATLDRLLDRWINVNRSALATAGSEYLFPTSHSDQIAPEYINQIVRRAASNAGLQDVVFTDANGRDHYEITAHTLRHSYAKEYLRGTGDIRSLQKLMGHAQIETTEKYLRLSEDETLDAARKNGPRID